ncbi:MAG: RluA family pseudouridine synthase [Hyphomicrobiaceae bacterium]
MREPAGQETVIERVVPPENSGLRLDRFAAMAVDALSRQRIQALIKDGCVSLDEQVCRQPNHKLKGGERVEIAVPAVADSSVLPEALPLDVVYEDDDLIVVDKPAGMVTHPAPGHEGGTLVNALLAHVGDGLAGIGGVKRPGIVHRLDKDTSGLLVVAKSDVAHQGLSGQFAAHGADGRLERSYRALVWGVPERPRGRITAALGRSPTNRRKVAVVSDERGRHAATNFRLLESFAGNRDEPVACLLTLTLETGRTHQIRVHLASIGHPIMGDKAYGAGYKASAVHLSERARDALTLLDRQALHAATLQFEHPLSGRRMQFESPMPGDMAALVAALRMQD